MNDRITNSGIAGRCSWLVGVLSIVALSALLWIMGAGCYSPPPAGWQMERPPFDVPPSLTNPPPAGVVS